MHLWPKACGWCCLAFIKNLFLTGRGGWLSLEATRSRYDCLRVPQNGAEHGRSVFQCGCQLVFQTHISRVRLHVSQKGTDMVGLWVLACLRSSWAWEPGWQRQAGGPGACLPAASCPRALPASLLHCTSPLHASCQGSIHTHTGGQTLLSDYLRTYFEDLFTQTFNHRPSMSAVPQWLLLRFFTFLVIKLSTSIVRFNSKRRKILLWDKYPCKRNRTT